MSEFLSIGHFRIPALNQGGVSVGFDDEDRSGDGWIRQGENPAQIAVFSPQLIILAELKGPVRAGSDAGGGNLESR
jgi:hypothetical protein